MRINPGVAGWVAVGVSVAVADGIAKARNLPTMSDEFARFYGWAAPFGAFVLTHLLLHKRNLCAYRR